MAMVRKAVCLAVLQGHAGGASLITGVRCYNLESGSAYSHPNVMKQTYVKVDAVKKYACGLRVDGWVDCWRYGEDPAQMPERALDIAVGWDSMCLAKVEGGVVCYSNHYNFGPHQYGESPAAFDGVVVRSMGVVEMYNSDRQVCALDEAGGLHCESDLPEPSGITGTKIVGNGYFFCVMQAAPSSVVCWAHDNDPNGGSSYGPDPDFRKLPENVGLVYDMDAWGWGGAFCVLNEMKRVHCYNHIASDPNGWPPAIMSFVDNSGAPYSEVAVGSRTVCAVREDSGTLQCWGLRLSLPGAQQPEDLGKVWGIGMGGRMLCMAVSTTSTTMSSATVTTQVTMTTRTTLMQTTSSTSKSSTSTWTTGTSVTSSSSITLSSTSSSATATATQTSTRSSSLTSSSTVSSTSSSATTVGTSVTSSSSSSLTSSSTGTWTSTQSRSTSSSSTVSSTVMETSMRSTSTSSRSNTLSSSTSLLTSATTGAVSSTSAVSTTGCVTSATSTSTASTTGRGTSTWSGSTSSSSSSLTTVSSTSTASGASSSTGTNRVSTAVTSSILATSTSLRQSSPSPLLETDITGSVDVASSTREVSTATATPALGSSLTSSVAEADSSQSRSPTSLAGSSAGPQKSDDATVSTSTAAAVASTAPLGQSEESAVQELADAVQRDAADFTASIWASASRNETRWERTSPTGPLVAQRILPEMIAEGLQVSVGGAAAAFSASVLAFLSNFSGSAVVVVGAINDTFTPANSGVTAPVSVEVHSGPGKQVHVANLPEPAVVKLPVSSSLRPTCVFWDAESSSWSTAGVTADLSSEELRCLTTHFSIFAALLQGVVNPVICSQVLTLFTFTAMAQIWSDDWLTGSGALALVAVLLWLLVSMIVAAVVDHAHTWGDEFFLNECRTPVVNEADEEGEAAVSSEEEIAPRGVVMRAACLGLALWGTCCHWLKSSTVVRDVLDNVMSRYFECFSEARNLCESACAAFEFEGMEEAHYLVHANLRRTSHLLMISLRRTVAASLGVSDELVAFVMQDEELKRFFSSEHDRYLDRNQALMLGGQNRLEGSLTTVERMQVNALDLQRQQVRITTLRQGRTRTASKESEGAAHAMVPAVRARFWSGARKLQRRASMGVLNQGVHWKAARSKREAWVLLHHAISDSMQSHGDLFLKDLGLIRLVMRIFAVQTPFTSSLFFDPLLPSKMRCMLLTVDLCGTFMLSVLFFKASGSVKGKSGRLQSSCAADEAEEVLAFQVGKLLAVATSSVLFSILPGSFLSSLHTRTFLIVEHEGCSAWQQRLHSWRMQDLLFWLLATSYSAFSVFTVVLFLANVTEQDQEAFAKTVLMALAEIFLVIPLVVSACVPVLSWLVLNSNHVLGIYERTAMMRLAREKMNSNSNLMLPIMYI